MILQDDRTPEQRQTHIWGIVANDKFMSNWGACPGKSVAIWALQDYDEAENFLKYIKNRRKCMKYLRLVNLTNYKIRPCYHCHIYPTNLPSLED